MDSQYVAVWPIADPHLSLDELIAEAEEEIVYMAHDDGAELVEAPTWQRLGDRLVATAAAVRYKAPAAFGGPLPWMGEQEFLAYMMPDGA